MTGRDSEDLQRATALVLAAGALDHTMYSFRIEGEPLATARARAGYRGGFYTPDKTTTAEDEIAWFLRSARGEPFTGNVAVAAVFYRSNRHRIDVDNLLKTVLDGITKSRVVWQDDSHVTAVAGIVELDAEWPRTAVAIAPHSSTLTRGVDSFTHKCETCGKAYRPHRSASPSRYCSRKCRPGRVLVCSDCGGPTSAPHVKRCRACHDRHRGVATA
jgi:Holliday junction resolvase RusA-like endonuclease